MILEFHIRRILTEKNINPYLKSWFRDIPLVWFDPHAEIFAMFYKEAKERRSVMDNSIVAREKMSFGKWQGLFQFRQIVSKLTHLYFQRNMQHHKVSPVALIFHSKKKKDHFTSYSHYSKV